MEVLILVPTPILCGRKPKHVEPTQFTHVLIMNSVVTLNRDMLIFPPYYAMLQCSTLSVYYNYLTLC